VLEDLHWADDALLSFVEHLADWSDGVPLLVLCTARPELYERHPTFGGNARNAQRVNLAPLTEEETAHLVAALLEQTVLPAGAQRILLERAGGNPLYAEEFVRLLADRGQVSEVVPEIPDTVQALIAARLDTLSPERKSLLQDASVVGKVFWSGALVELGERDLLEVEQALHELARKELVRPARTSSMEGEAEYAFWHAVVRDVCYAQIPRASRAVRHAAAAAWIERKAGERIEDLAEVLAHHYLHALDLGRASGQTEHAAEIEASAVRNFALAGERALALDVDSAEANLARALALCPAGDSRRPGLLERWAYAAHQQGRLHEARAALEEAGRGYEEQGDAVAVGRTLVAILTPLTNLGDPRRGEVLTRAITLLEGEPPGPDLVAAYAELVAFHVVFASDWHAAIAAAGRALALAAELGLPEPARARGFLGFARASLGKREGLDDLRRAIVLSLERGQSRDVAVFHANLAESLWVYEGPAAALEVAREGVAFADRRGIIAPSRHTAAESLHYLIAAGRPADALAEAALLRPELEASGAIALTYVLSAQLLLHAERGDPGLGPPDAERLSAAVQATTELQLIAVGLPAAARMLLAHDRRADAVGLLAELEQTPGIRRDTNYAAGLPALVRCALSAGDADLAARLAEGVESITPLHAHALLAASAQLAEARGAHADAAERYAGAAEEWRRFGDVPERAYALLGRGRCLHALGDEDAADPLREARALFASLGYRRALAEADALLGDAETASTSP
jgi:hypothetical protein